MSYWRLGMSPNRMMTAWSASSSIFINTRCQGVPLTLTERPFESTSETICTPRELVEPPAAEESSSSSSFVMPSEARDCSSEASDEANGDDRMKVAETEVISRTARDKEGRHGRMECHCEWSFILSVSLSFVVIKDIVVRQQQVC